MNVVFRVDASVDIGSGHLMRCLTLAEALRPAANVVFVCRHLLPSLEQLLLDKGFSIRRLRAEAAEYKVEELIHSHWLGTSQYKDAQDTVAAMKQIGKCDWLVIDHYGLDYRFETQLREYVGRILVIDDLADRIHNCDVLIDQNPYADMQTRYLGKVPDYCRCLLGTQFCLLREEFVRQREIRAPRLGVVRSILIYFGGVDRYNRTQEAVEAVLSVAGGLLAARQMNVNVVVGAGHPAAGFLQALCTQEGMGFHIQTRNMAQLMSQADLAIGAGGISTFERLYLGLPALLTPIADNQREALHYMKDLGYFALYESREELEGLLHNVLVSGTGSPPDCVHNGVPVLLQIMSQQATRLQPPSALDIRRTYKWLQNSTLRHDFQLTTTPTRIQHFSYWRKLLHDHSQRVYAIYFGRQHVGNCGLKNIDFTDAACELWIYLGDDHMRRKGVATSAVKILKEIAAQKLQCRSIYLHVNRSNEPAVRLYRSTGFIASEDALLPPWDSRDADMQKMVCLL